MKWGKWNPETAARYSGGKHKKIKMKDLEKVIKKSKSKDFIEAEKAVQDRFGDLRSEETKRLKKEMLYKADKWNDPVDSKVFKVAQAKAAKEYLKKELSRPDAEELYPENTRFRRKLEDYAYWEHGYDAGMKAFNEAHPNHSKIEKEYDEAIDKYHNSLSSDVDNLIKKRKMNKTTSVSTNSGQTYMDLVYRALDRYE